MIVFSCSSFWRGWLITLQCQQSEQSSKLKDDLAGPLRVMQEAARRIAKIAIESKLTLVEGPFYRSFTLSLRSR
jgi:hypothetical protein